MDGTTDLRRGSTLGSWYQRTVVLSGPDFPPADVEAAERAQRVLEKYALVEGAQVFVSAEKFGSPSVVLSDLDLDLDRVVYCVREQAERETRERGCSCTCRRCRRGP